MILFFLQVKTVNIRWVLINFLGETKGPKKILGILTFSNFNNPWKLKFK